jgi:hypothetical protein
MTPTRRRFWRTCSGGNIKSAETVRISPTLCSELDCRCRSWNAVATRCAYGNPIGLLTTLSIPAQKNNRRALLKQLGFLAAARTALRCARIAISPCSMKASPAFLIQRLELHPLAQVSPFQHTEARHRSISWRREHVGKPGLRARGATAAVSSFNRPNESPAASFESCPVRPVQNQFPEYTCG